MKRFKVPLYGVTLRFFDSTEQAAEYVKDKTGEDHTDRAYASDGMAMWVPDCGVVLAIDKDVATPDVVAHEALHAAWFVLDAVGVECTPDNHEALAYLAGWIVDKWGRSMSQ